MPSSRMDREISKIGVKCLAATPMESMPELGCGHARFCSDGLRKGKCPGASNRANATEETRRTESPHGSRRLVECQPRVAQDLLYQNPEAAYVILPKFAASPPTAGSSPPTCLGAGVIDVSALAECQGNIGIRDWVYAVWFDFDPRRFSLRACGLDPIPGTLGRRTEIE